MTGSIKITEIEKQEMREDAANMKRRIAFCKAREYSQKGSLDDYIDFLSENMEYLNLSPTPKITNNYKL
ncbi:MAG: hypothetical protein JRJ04_16845 [Deltaproteobacteria bacterium]|nr:hypothetical protein [Deltaproteobacteria bacterium]